MICNRSLRYVLLILIQAKWLKVPFSHFKTNDIVIYWGTRLINKPSHMYKLCVELTLKMRNQCVCQTLQLCISTNMHFILNTEWIWTMLIWKQIVYLFWRWYTEVRYFLCFCLDDLHSDEFTGYLMAVHPVNDGYNECSNAWFTLRQKWAQHQQLLYCMFGEI